MADNTFKRFVKQGNKKVELRVVPPTKEAIEHLGNDTFKTVYGSLAINPPFIERSIAKQKAELVRSLALMQDKDRKHFLKTPVDFVADKTGYKQYDIICARCGDAIANCWATDDTLEDWCDLHYMCWHDKNTWYGAMSVNVSKIDGKLGFECACGEDTRDWRMNKSLAPVVKQLLIEYSMKHRDFGKPTSKFVAIPRKK